MDTAACSPSGAVDNDATIEIYAQMAVLHGSWHPSGRTQRHDGRPGRGNRDALDAAEPPMWRSSPIP